MRKHCINISPFTKKKGLNLSVNVSLIKRIWLTIENLGKGIMVGIEKKVSIKKKGW